jgi:hypothetical protein
MATETALSLLEMEQKFTPRAVTGMDIVMLMLSINISCGLKNTVVPSTRLIQLDLSTLSTAEMR